VAVAGSGYAVNPMCLFWRAFANPPPQKKKKRRKEATRPFLAALLRGQQGVLLRDVLLKKAL
jgi:hypothetical protein